MKFSIRIAVFGGRNIEDDVYKDVTEIGRLIAAENWLVYCGGGKGVMEAIAKGVQMGGGTCVGILKGTSLEESNGFLTVPVATGMGISRNALLAYNCDAALAISGQYGTLSEIAYAFQLNKPVIGYKTWDLEGIHKVKSPTEVIEKVRGLLE
ncbi:MAG: TIGR00725 family protein [Fidelibacterota bacterium]